MTEQSVEAAFEELRSLVERTEVREIRLQQLSGEVLRTPPSEMEINVTHSPPQFSRQPGSLLALFSQSVEYIGSDEESDTGQGPVGNLQFTHIVELELRGEDVPSDDAISHLVNSNVLFMVYPYIRAALQRVPTDFGLPPVFLPYLRRDTGGRIVNHTMVDAPSD